MRLINKLTTICLGALFLVCVSCSKEGINPYSGSIWSGTYPVQTINNTSKETEDHNAVIILSFRDGGDKCNIQHGIEGMYGMTSVIYEARWSASNQFGLYSTAAGQSILCYSGTISGDKMALQALNCDRVAATYELNICVTLRD